MDVDVLKLYLYWAGVLWLLLGTYIAVGMAASAPVGGLICLALAARRKEGRFRQSALGTASWACGLLPWLYFVMYGMRGRLAPSWLVWTGYVLLFSVWLSGPIGGGFAWVLVRLVSQFAQDGALPYLWYLFPLGNIALMAWSLFVVVSEYRKRGFGALGPKHLLPFGLCLAGYLSAHFLVG